MSNITNNQSALIIRAKKGGKIVYDTDRFGVCQLCHGVIQPGQAQVIQSNGLVTDALDVQVAHLQCFKDNE